MKRLAMVALLAVVLVAVGCGTPPPQYWKPPVVQSLVVSTNTIVAGSAFSVTVTATDDHAVDRVGFLFYDATNNGPMHVSCVVAPWTPALVVTVEATCTMPSVAANGAWTLRVEATDAEFSGGGEGACGCGAKQTALTVTGGTEDREAPVVDSIVFAPQTVTVGTAFSVGFRVTDEHPGDWNEPLWLAYVPDSGDAVTCVQTSHTALSATQHTWTFDCPAPTSVDDPLLFGSIRDAAGYNGYVWQRFDVLAA